MYYNRVRHHTHLGGVSPEAFEQASFEVYRCHAFRGKFKPFRPGPRYARPQALSGMIPPIQEDAIHGIRK